jgi:hypothetical protein
MIGVVPDIDEYLYAIFLTVDLAGESEGVWRGGATGWWTR